LIFLLKKWHPEVYDDKTSSTSVVVNTSAPKPEIVAQIEAADANNNRILAILEERLKL
jgi:cephalosporin hydroxylase